MIAEYRIIAVTKTLMNAVFDKMSVDIVSFTPLINNTINRAIERAIREAKDIAPAIKNDLNILLSFDLYAIVIEK